MTTLEDITRLLPDYELGREIGRGEFGVVWQARHRQLDRDVAVKQLAGPVAADPAHAARFRREAQLLATLDHPHVVRMFDYREEGSSRLLIMELLPGGTLADRRAAGLMLAPAAASIMAAASGLHHVHEQGVLHRDVKPENLMFDGRGVLKVTDFGIARDDTERSTSVHVTRAEEFFGTPAYIAPEQAAPSLGGGWPPIGRAADEYSLAAVLYEMISGRLTHDPTGGWVALCHARMNEEPRPLREWVPALPRAVDEVVLRALARDPAARYPSVEAFAVALGDAMRASYGDGWYTDSDVTIREPGAIRDAAQPSRPVAVARGSAPPPRRRTRSLAVLGVVVALAAAAGAYLAIDDGGHGGAGTPLAFTLRPVWTAETGDRVFVSPVLADRAVIVGSEDTKIYGLDPATGRRLWAPLTTGGKVFASAASSGSTAYVGSYDESLYAIDVTKGTQIWKQPLDVKIVSSAVVAGGDVLVGGRNLVAVDATTGQPRWTLPTSAGVQSSPAVADGVVVVGAQDGSVVAADLAGHQLWTYRVADAVDVSPVIAGSVVYVASFDGVVTALDLHSGTPAWHRSLGSRIKSTPLVVGDRLVVGTVDGRLASPRPPTARPDGRSTHGSVVSSPKALGRWVVVGSNGGDVDAVDASTGVLAGRLHVGGPVLSSPLVLGNRVVVGSDDGSVYAVGGFA